LDERLANTLRIAGATLLALAIFSTAWFVVAMSALQLGGRLGLSKEGAETLVKGAWFVGTALGGFAGLWVTGTLVRGVPVRSVFLAFTTTLAAMFGIALLAFLLEGGFTEASFSGGMIAQLALGLAGAWYGKRVVERGRG
jgi:hypothetical protein